MVTLATRQETTEVSVEHYSEEQDPDDPDAEPEVIRFRMRTISDDEFSRMVDDEVSFGEQGEMRMNAGVSRLVGLFKDKVLGADNLDIEAEDGEVPFDADDPAHVEAVPFQWKVDVAGELLDRASLSEGQVKN